MREKDSANCIVRLHSPESFPCLHPGCTASCPTADSLGKHIEAHFTNLQESQLADSPYHPFDNLAALHVAAGAINLPTASSFADSIPPTTVLTSTDITMSETQSPTSTNSSARSYKTRSFCDICNKSFSRFADLERHAKKHQAGEQTNVYQKKPSSKICRSKNIQVRI